MKNKTFNYKNLGMLTVKAINELFQKCLKKLQGVHKISNFRKVGNLKA